NNLSRLDKDRDYVTAGYHDYTVTDEGLQFANWRDADILLQVHNFKNTLNGDISPTGVLLIDNFEYRYEDCYINQQEGEVDLYITSGLQKETAPLYTKNSIPSDGDITLYLGGSIDSGGFTL